MKKKKRPKLIDLRVSHNQVGAILKIRAGREELADIGAAILFALHDLAPGVHHYCGQSSFVDVQTRVLRDGELPR